MSTQVDMTEFTLLQHECSDIELANENDRFQFNIGCAESIRRLQETLDAAGFSRTVLVWPRIESDGEINIYYTAKHAFVKPNGSVVPVERYSADRLIKVVETTH